MAVMLIFALIALWCVRMLCYDNTPGAQRWVDGPIYYVMAGLIVGLLFAAGLIMVTAMQGEVLMWSRESGLIVVAMN